MAHNEKFDHESIQDAETIKRYIGSILDGIEGGRIVLSSNSDEIVLRPGPLLKLTVKAKNKGDSGKLIFAISWKDPSRSVEDQGEIRISS